MKLLKLLFATLLCMVLLFGVAGCNDDPTFAPEEEVPRGPEAPREAPMEDPDTPDHDPDTPEPPVN